MMNILAYADGKHTLLQIADLIDIPIWQIAPILNTLLKHKLLEL
jgi:aminopeptidase-like protein